MRKILLATTLLSIAISEDILVDKKPRPAMWIREKQLPGKRPKRASRDDILSELEDVPNYDVNNDDDDDRQFPRISVPQFINEPVQLPPVIRRSNLVRFLQDDSLLSNRSKFASVKPTVLISIGIRDKNAASTSQEECSTRNNYHKHIQNWQLQPLYVEEPRWVNIDADYTELSTRHSENGDPYIMSRGKKFRMMSPDKLEKTIEEFLDYTSKSKRWSTKNRVRRSVGTTTEELQGDSIADETRNQEEETGRQYLLRDPHTSKVVSIQAISPDEESSKADESSDENAERKNPARDIFVEGLEMNEPRNSTKESPYGRKFAKRNRATANTLITSSAEEERKIQREMPSYMKSGDDKIVKVDKRFHSQRNLNFAVGTNKRADKVLEDVAFVRGHGKRGNREIGWINADYEGNIDRKKATMFERMRLRDGYLDKIENFSTYSDLFIPSRGKKPLGKSDGSDKRPSRSSTGQWEDSSSTQRYAHREEPGSEEREVDEAKEDESGTDQDGSRSTDAPLMTKPDSKSFSGMRTLANYREKRNIYDTKPDLRKNALLSNIEREIVEAVEAYLRPRDKHGNILDLQNDLSTDPFFIMRGKKASHELPDAVSSVTERRDDMEDVAQAMYYSIEKNLLKMLLTERSKCNEQYCDTEASRPLKDKPVLRNRRNPLDKLFSKYDPFVIIRGKRAKPDNF